MPDQEAPDTRDWDAVAPLLGRLASLEQELSALAGVAAGAREAGPDGAGGSDPYSEGSRARTSTTSSLAAPVPGATPIPAKSSAT